MRVMMQRRLEMLEQYLLVDSHLSHWEIIQRALITSCLRVDVPVIQVVYQFRHSYVAFILLNTAKKHSLT
jgi:hypothetical protein